MCGQGVAISWRRRATAGGEAGDREKLVFCLLCYVLVAGEYLESAIEDHEDRRVI